MNTSAMGGFLAPTNTPPLDDAALTDLLQVTISALSGIPGDNVRPRWQAEPPNLPAINQTWAAIGITGRKHDTYPYQTHQADDDNGHNRLARNEEFVLLCSFYGPANDAAASYVVDGFQIAQNRDALAAYGIVLVQVGDRTAAPEHINNRWYDRTDMPITFRRMIVRDYPVLDLLTAQGGATARTESGNTLATELTSNNHG